MLLVQYLKERGMSVYECSKKSGIPYTTLLELAKGKTSIEKCTAETIYRLAFTLNTDMDELYDMLRTFESRPRATFEIFKSNLCHIVKEKGDMEFIVETLESDLVNRYWARKWYPEAYYTLAMIDYLSRINELPICKNYESIRCTSLKETIFPKDIELTAKLDPSLNIKEQAIADSIPEFIRFNIVEKEVRDVC